MYYTPYWRYSTAADLSFKLPGDRMSIHRRKDGVDQVGDIGACHA